MSEVTHQDIKNTPGQLMFTTFINILLREQKATEIENKKNMYVLNSDSSNSFITGRDQSLNPFIGIQEDMLPWFPEMSWTEIAVSYKKGYAYLISREEEGEVKVVLGLKIRRKRLIAIIDPKNRDVGKSLNIKIFKILEDKEVAISHKNLKNNIKISIINDVEDILTRDTNKHVENNTISQRELTEMYRVNLQGYDKAPSGFEAKRFFKNAVPLKQHYEQTLSLINAQVMEGYGYNIKSKSFQEEFLPEFVSDYLNKNNNSFNSIAETGTYKLILNLKNNPNPSM
jgi:hypothetical protein